MGISLNVSAVFSKPLNLRKTNTTFQHGVARIPTATKIEAEFTEETITVKTYRYFGSVQINVCDRDGNIIKSHTGHTDEHNEFTIDVSNIENGDYLLYIITENGTFMGTFSIKI